MKPSLLVQLFLGILLGIIVGRLTPSDSDFLGIPFVEFYALLRDLFLNAFMLIVIPLIASLIIVKVSSTNRPLKDLSFKLFGTFALAVLFAVGLSWAVVSFSQIFPQALERFAGYSTGSVFDIFRDIVLLIIPSNIIQASIQANLLAVALFSFVFGLAMAQIENQEAASTLRKFFNGSFDILKRLLTLLLRALPVGIFGLVAHFTALHW